MQYPDVSVVIPYRDDEEVIGTLIAAIAGHLRRRVPRFEVLAVNDDSGDNSSTLLAFISTEHPELGRIEAPGRGQGHAVGARHATGRIVWFVEPATALALLPRFDLAYHHIRSERLDLLVADGLALARRGPVVPVLGRIRGRGGVFHRRLIARARQHQLVVHSPGLFERPAGWWARLTDMLPRARWLSGSRSAPMSPPNRQAPAHPGRLLAHR